MKKEVKEWLASVTQKKNSEWLILQIVRPEVGTRQRNVFGFTGTVISKLKADFITDDRDR